MKFQLDSILKQKLWEDVRLYQEKNQNPESQQDSQVLLLVLESSEYSGQPFQTSQDLFKVFEQLYSTLKSTWVIFFGQRLFQRISSHSLVKALRKTFAQHLVAALEREAKMYLAIAIDCERQCYGDGEMKQKRPEQQERQEKQGKQKEAGTSGGGEQESLEQTLSQARSVIQKLTEENQRLCTSLKGAGDRIKKLETDNWDLRNTTIPRLAAEVAVLKKTVQGLSQEFSSLSSSPAASFSGSLAASTVSHLSRRRWSLSIEEERRRAESLRKGEASENPESRRSKGFGESLEGSASGSHSFPDYFDARDTRSVL